MREVNDEATEQFIERVLAGLVPAIDYQADAAERAAAEIRAPLSADTDRLVAEHSTGPAEAAHAAAAAREAQRIQELLDWHALHGADA
jgi:hypothetical protein